VSYRLHVGLEIVQLTADGGTASNTCPCLISGLCPSTGTRTAFFGRPDVGANAHSHLTGWTSRHTLSSSSPTPTYAVSSFCARTTFVRIILPLASRKFPERTSSKLCTLGVSLMPCTVSLPRIGRVMESFVHPGICCSCLSWHPSCHHCDLPPAVSDRPGSRQAQETA
jgi:hypothetical protein